MILNNPYYYHPQLAVKQVADDVLSTISECPEWDSLFRQGKMLGILLLNPQQSLSSLSSRVHYLNKIPYLVAYSGVVNGFDDVDQYFVPSVYDLQNPDDFYLQKDSIITSINQELASSDSLASSKIKRLKAERRQLSIALQREIFSHFNFLNPSGNYRNIIDIFADAKRGLPPGGAGECAAPRLLQYAYEHGLQPLQLAEFWYGTSPAGILRQHGHFYPSCIEKCSPILRYMIPSLAESVPTPLPSVSAESLRVIYEDQYMLAVHKPSGLLSVPSKDMSQPNVEVLLHLMYPEIKGPMLVHRLDQATSGMLLAAKDAPSFKLLTQMFAEKTIQKRYLARIKGKLKSRCGIISLPLSVNPDDRPRQVVDHQFGKEAITYYETLVGNFDGVSVPADETLVALYPLTGRTHQLRVHCASPAGLDHPIVGDVLYDIMSNEKKSAPRLMLHAESIALEHPVTHKRLTIVDRDSSF